MKIAIEGCAHGEMDKIYEAIAYIQNKENIKIDLLISCGDFQAVRNTSDLKCMAVPPKYQRMNTFYKYYSGEKIAPILTIFVGGNHEASNHLQELPYGGWVCPNVYYMGYAGIVQIGGLRIGGLSGIYKGQDYLKGHHEFPPYDESSKRSVYHIRNVEVFRLKQVSRPLDIVISHDWPRGIYHYGDKKSLFKFKPFLQEDAESNKLGSRPGEELIHHLQPSYWFAAHLHAKFSAIIEHKKESFFGSSRTTKFLALDKCLPHRQFLQIVDIPHDESQDIKLSYDPEWLAILKATNHLWSTSSAVHYMPGPGASERWDFRVTDEDIHSIQKIFDYKFEIPHNFKLTVPVFVKNVKGNEPKVCINPQTSAICFKLSLTDPNEVYLGGSSPASHINFYVNEQEANITQTPVKNETAYTISEDENGDKADSVSLSGSLSSETEDIINSSVNIDDSSTDSSKSSSSKSSDQSSLEQEGNNVLASSFSAFISEVKISTDDLEFTSSSRQSSGSSKRSYDDSEIISSMPVIKKFKQRNKAIYASNNDHDDDEDS